MQRCAALPPSLQRPSRTFALGLLRREKENVGARRRKTVVEPGETEGERDGKADGGKERATREGERRRQTRRREREELGRTFLARVPPLYRAPVRSTRRIRASRSGLERP